MSDQTIEVFSTDLSEFFCDVCSEPFKDCEPRVHLIELSKDSKDWVDGDSRQRITVPAHTHRTLHAKACHALYKNRIFQLFTASVISEAPRNALASSDMDPQERCTIGQRHRYLYQAYMNYANLKETEVKMVPTLVKTDPVDPSYSMTVVLPKDACLQIMDRNSWSMTTFSTFLQQLGVYNITFESGINTAKTTSATMRESIMDIIANSRLTGKLTHDVHAWVYESDTTQEGVFVLRLVVFAQPQLEYHDILYHRFRNEQTVYWNDLFDQTEEEGFVIGGALHTVVQRVRSEIKKDVKNAISELLSVCQNKMPTVKTSIKHVRTDPFSSVSMPLVVTAFQQQISMAINHQETNDAKDYYVVQWKATACASSSLSSSSSSSSSSSPSRYSMMPFLMRFKGGSLSSGIPLQTSDETDETIEDIMSSGCFSKHKDRLTKLVIPPRF